MTVTAARPARFITHHAAGPLALTQRGLIEAIGAPLSWIGDDLPALMLYAVLGVLALRVLQPPTGCSPEQHLPATSQLTPRPVPATVRPHAKQQQPLCSHRRDRHQQQGRAGLPVHHKIAQLALEMAPQSLVYMA